MAKLANRAGSNDPSPKPIEVVLGVVSPAMIGATVAVTLIGLVTTVPPSATARPAAHASTALEVATAPFDSHVAELVAQRQKGLLVTVAKISQTERDILLDRRHQTSRANAMAVTNEISRLRKEIDRLRNLSRFLWPTKGRVSSGFGWRIHPVLGYRRMHNGADIPAACNNPIFAAQSGKVVRTGTGYSGGSGNNVRIDHGSIDGRSIQTAYLHMTRFIVKARQHVNKGEVIGFVGSTGLSTSCHLHVSLYKDGAGSDPLEYIKK